MQEEESWRVIDVQAHHPCILANLQEFLATITNKRVVVFLDYDGTLTPIVSNPDDAHMSSAMRQVVCTVAETFPTTIISGRGRQKVECFVQLPELFYAGSHGLDIKGPVVCVFHS
jgi:trehalose 6-phosphate phosphatase